MLDLNIPSINLDTANEGSWIVYQGDISFCIARSGNPAYKSALAAMYKVNKRGIDGGSLPDGKAEILMNDLVSRHIVKGWKGLVSNGEPVEFTVDACNAILNDERYTELRDWILEMSRENENFREEERKK